MKKSAEEMLTFYTLSILHFNFRLRSAYFFNEKSDYHKQYHKKYKGKNYISPVKKF